MLLLKFKRIIGILFVGSVVFPLVYGLVFNGFCTIFCREYLSFQVTIEYGRYISQSMYVFRKLQIVYDDFYQFGFAISLLMTVPLFYKKEINNYISTCILSLFIGFTGSLLLTLIIYFSITPPLDMIYIGKGWQGGIESTQVFHLKNYLFIAFQYAWIPAFFNYCYFQRVLLTMSSPNEVYAKK